MCGLCSARTPGHCEALSTLPDLRMRQSLTAVNSCMKSSCGGQVSTLARMAPKQMTCACQLAPRLINLPLRPLPCGRDSRQPCSQRCGCGMDSPSLRSSRMSQCAQRITPLEAYDDTPVVLQFPIVARRLASFDLEEGEDAQQTPLDRARLQHRNRCCPNCRRITVDPVELDNALLNRRGVSIPGSATVVGFVCRSCKHEWHTERLRVIASAE